MWGADGDQLTKVVPCGSGGVVMFISPIPTDICLVKLGNDQVEDYAQRKGQTVESARQWLAPWLNES